MRGEGTLRLRRRTLTGAALAAAALGSAALAGTASANHPVLVEGNCFGPGAGMGATGLQVSPVPAGTCGDFDGDGNIGVAEDTDGDNNYGTINAALAAVAQNGRVTIVADGTYPEIVTINPVNGASVTLEARPGVTANVEAFVQGQAPGPVTGGTTQAQRLGSPGIIVNAAADTRVQIRNIITRNWTDGVLLQGASRAVLDGVVAEGNINFGVHLTGDSRATIANSQINGNGFRAGSGAGPANPGTGVGIEGSSQASVAMSSITGNAGAGIDAPSNAAITLGADVQLFNNNPNLRVAGQAVEPPPPTPFPPGKTAGNLPACTTDTTIPQVPRGEGGNPASVRLSAGQLLINQRISQAGVRRVNTALDLFTSGLTAANIRDCTVTLADLNPALRTALQAGAATGSEVVGTEGARPTPTRRTERRGGDVVLSRAQLLINQRISQAAVRRVNAVRERLDQGITAGDIRRGSLDASVLDTQLRQLLGDGAPAEGTFPITVRPITPAAPGERNPGSVTLSRQQLLINQRISQAAVRRINQIRAEIDAGLVGSQIQNDSLSRANLTPAVQRGD